MKVQAYLGKHVNNLEVFKYSVIRKNICRSEEKKFET